MRALRNVNVCESVHGRSMYVCVVEARSLCLPGGTVAGERLALTCVSRNRVFQRLH